MFDKTGFEQKFYALITQEVNAVFSDLLKDGNSPLVQKEGIEIQKQIMESLHSIIEETVIQIFYGLLVYREGALK